MRASYYRRSTSDCPKFSAECQAEKRRFATSISLLYEFESKTLNEIYIYSYVWKQAENRIKTLQEDRNSMIVGQAH